MTIEIQSELLYIIQFDSSVPHSKFASSKYPSIYSVFYSLVSKVIHFMKAPQHHKPHLKTICLSNVFVKPHEQQTVIKHN